MLTAKTLSDDAENNAAVASAGSNNYVDYNYAAYRSELS